MPYDIEMEEWHEELERRRFEAQQLIEQEDIDYDIENPDEDEPVNKIGRF
jgi:hypothetical protein